MGLVQMGHKRVAAVFHSFYISNGDTDSNAATAQHTIADRNVPASSLGHTIL